MNFYEFLDKEVGFLKVQNLLSGIPIKNHIMYVIKSDIDTFIPLEVFMNLKELTNLLLWDRQPQQFPIETECYIKEPKFVVPYMARKYATEFYFYENEVLTSNELAQKIGWENFKGTCHYSHVYFKEIWEDYGNDGHIDMRLEGYQFFLE